MVCLRKCNACINGDHKNCTRSDCDPGKFGGSLCTCLCHGDPDYKDPFIFECEHGEHVDDYCTGCHVKLEVKARKK